MASNAYELSIVIVRDHQDIRMLLNTSDVLLAHRLYIGNDLLFAIGIARQGMLCEGKAGLRF